MPRLLLTPGKDPVPIVQEAGWAPEPVWTGAENLSPNEIRSPDRPACSQLLYRLRYSAHIREWTYVINIADSVDVHVFKVFLVELLAYCMDL